MGKPIAAQGNLVIIHLRYYYTVSTINSPTQDGKSRRSGAKRLDRRTLIEACYVSRLLTVEP